VVRAPLAAVTLAAALAAVGACTAYDSGVFCNLYHIQIRFYHIHRGGFGKLKRISESARTQKHVGVCSRDGKALKPDKMQTDEPKCQMAA
jgi:hypothetical protein